MFDPAGDIHTLRVPEGCDEMITIFHITGAMVDADGRQIGYEDAQTTIDVHRAHYTADGVGGDYVDQFVRVREYPSIRLKRHGDEGDEGDGSFRWANAPTIGERKVPPLWAAASSGAGRTWWPRSHCSLAAGAPGRRRGVLDRAVRRRG